MSIICFGELIIDFASLEPGKQLWEVERFLKKLGGASANVAIGHHYHGVPVKLWSKVGNLSKDDWKQFFADKPPVSVPAEKIKEVDTTGAGDAFTNLSNRNP